MNPWLEEERFRSSERGFYARYVNDTIQLLRKFHGSKEIPTADGIRMISREKATKE